MTDDRIRKIFADGSHWAKPTITGRPKEWFILYARQIEREALKEAVAIVEEARVASRSERSYLGDPNNVHSLVQAAYSEVHDRLLKRFEATAQ